MPGSSDSERLALQIGSVVGNLVEVLSEGNTSETSITKILIIPTDSINLGNNAEEGLLCDQATEIKKCADLPGKGRTCWCEKKSLPTQ
ncbi:MAG: hypothetical protein AAFV72_20565 [Cyanobacteria bacterium J06635_1]